MNTLELKKNLKLQIDAINDEKLLNAIYILLDSKNNDIIYLSDFQKAEIKSAQKEYQEGNYIENNVVNEEIEKWLKEK